MKSFMAKDAKSLEKIAILLIVSYKFLTKVNSVSI